MPMKVVPAHCFVTYLLSFKTVRDTHQWNWFYAHFFNAHLLSFKMVRDLYYPAWNNSTQGHIYLICLGWAKVSEG